MRPCHKWSKKKKKQFLTLIHKFGRLKGDVQGVIMIIPESLSLLLQRPASSPFLWPGPITQMDSLSISAHFPPRLPFFSEYPAFSSPSNFPMRSPKIPFFFQPPLFSPFPACWKSPFLKLPSFPKLPIFSFILSLFFQNETFLSPTKKIWQFPFSKILVILIPK